MENEKKSEWGGYEMPEGMYEDLFGEVLKARDYEPTKEEISMENDKQTNTGNGKNYTFQNSTVNIYEEGNAIKILQEQIELQKKREEFMISSIGKIMETAMDYFNKRNEAVTSPKAPKQRKRKDNGK